MMHIPFDPSTLAETAQIWWGLFNYYLFLAILVGGGTILGLIALAWIYRHREALFIKGGSGGQGNPGELPDEIKPGVVPSERGSGKATLLLILVIIGVFMAIFVETFITAREWVELPASSHHLEVEVIAFQWGWTFRYPNGIESDKLVLPAGRPVIFKVTSEDVFHTFSIPDLRVKADAIPGRTVVAWTIPSQPGTFRIQCFELCGIGHAEMVTQAIVLPEDLFNFWYESLGEAAVELSPEAGGR